MVRKSVMFSNVIVDIAFPRRSFVFSQSNCEVLLHVFVFLTIKATIATIQLQRGRFVTLSNKFSSETMAGVLGRFPFATAAEKQLKQRKHCIKHCLLVVDLEKVVFREGNGQENRKLRSDPD